MSKVELLQQYKKDVNNLRKCAKELNFSDREIESIFNECFKQLCIENESFNRSQRNAQRYFSTLFKCVLICTSVLVCVYILLNVHQPTSSLVLRNVQGLIYPGLKVLRSISIPIIKKYPFLTGCGAAFVAPTLINVSKQISGLYDESCLVENPYFYVADMECWPCENVHSVIDLTGFDNHSLYDSGAPYVAKTPQKEVSYQMLRKLYQQYKETFDTEANKIQSSNSSVSNLEELFQDALQSSTHVAWRMNKMGPARLIRTLFPRPYIISEWSGQSIERFLMIDGPNAGPYVLPSTECSNIVVIQGAGERTLILNPSKECGDVCRTVSTVLKPSYILWYNWWYWRPISLPPENSTETSLTYITSYC